MRMGACGPETGARVPSEAAPPDGMNKSARSNAATGALPRARTARKSALRLLRIGLGRRAAGRLRRWGRHGIPRLLSLRLRPRDLLLSRRRLRRSTRLLLPPAGPPAGEQREQDRGHQRARGRRRERRAPRFPGGAGLVLLLPAAPP